MWAYVLCLLINSANLPSGALLIISKTLQLQKSISLNSVSEPLKD